MKHFTMKELTDSVTAVKHKLNNTPGEREIQNLNKLVTLVLDPLRESWGKPIKLTCAFRSISVNAKVGGHPNSHHTYGCAADIVCPTKDQDKMMEILMSNPHVDLCQNYPDRNFIHVNIGRPGETPRNLAMTQYKGQKAVYYARD